MAEGRGRSQAASDFTADVRMTGSNAPASPAGSPRDRRAEMFAGGGPEVAIAGVDVWRATITRSDDQQDDDGSQDDRGLHWHITGVPSRSRNDPLHLLLVGDLTCSSGGWFVGVTATCILAFRDHSPFDADDIDQVNAATRRLAPWAANVLYDTAAARARSLVAASASCAIDVPLLTPETHVAQIESAPRPDDAAELQADRS